MSRGVEWRMTPFYLNTFWWVKENDGGGWRSADHQDQTRLYPKSLGQNIIGSIQFDPNASYLDGFLCFFGIWNFGPSKKIRKFFIKDLHLKIHRIN
jgi:hypothetical protein